MKKTLAITCLVVGGSLAAPMISYAGEDADMDRSQPSTFVKDSAITTQDQSKTRFRASGQPDADQVDTDANGVVWFSGTAKTQSDIDKAVAIAKGTDGVVTVKNNLKVKPA